MWKLREQLLAFDADSTDEELRRVVFGGAEAN